MAVMAVSLFHVKGKKGKRRFQVCSFETLPAELKFEYAAKPLTSLGLGLGKMSRFEWQKHKDCSSPTLPYIIPTTISWVSISNNPFNTYCNTDYLYAYGSGYYQVYRIPA